MSTVRNEVEAVDPFECGCDDCIVGYSKPYDATNESQKLALISGSLTNRTGLTFDQIAGQYIEEGGSIADLADALLLGVMSGVEYR